MTFIDKDLAQHLFRCERQLNLKCSEMDTKHRIESEILLVFHFERKIRAEKYAVLYIRIADYFLQNSKRDDPMTQSLNCFSTTKNLFRCRRINSQSQLNDAKKQF